MTTKPKNFKAYKKLIASVPGLEVKGATTSAGTVQFPHDKPLPIALVKKIVKYRVKSG